MRRIIAIAALAAGVLAMGMFAGACGGGGSDALTLEEFFDELVALSDKQDSDSSAIEADFNALGEDASVDDVVDLLDQQVGVIETFVNGIDGLDAPDEAKDIQDRAVSAGNDVVEQFGAAVSDARDAATVDDVFLVFDNEELNTAFDALDQVCLDAQQLADDNNIDADLKCNA